MEGRRQSHAGRAEGRVRNARSVALQRMYLAASGDDEGTVTLDLRHIPVLDEPEFAMLRRIIELTEALGRELILQVSSGPMLSQLEAHRLHRRVSIDRQRPLSPLRDWPPIVHQSVLATSQAQRLDVQAIVDGLEGSSVVAAAQLIDSIASQEDYLYERNLIEPYGDIIPQIVVKLSPSRLAGLLAELSCSQAERIIFGDYTRIADEVLAKGVELMAPSVFADIAATAVAQVDSQSRVVPLLAGLSPHARSRYARALRPDVLEAVVRAAERASEARTVARAAGERRWMDWADRLQPSEQPWRLPASAVVYAAGTGVRETRRMGGGRVTRIRESLDFGPRRKPVVVDLFELRPEQVRIECFMQEKGRPTYAEVVRELEGVVPGSALQGVLERSGMFRLSELVRESKAYAGINGNFFFDYGHITNGAIIGLDLAGVPDLRFGDPVGWFVHDGRELMHPIYNRCSLVATTDGCLHIGRVKMTGVRIGGRDLRWDVENDVASATDIAMYTNLWGQRSPHRRGVVDVAVQRGFIVATGRGGDLAIPLAGFVLSLPGVHPMSVGDAVVVYNNFDRGRVAEAMACGPQLVRGGEICVDFRAEEFGRKDSSVMSFFLPRKFDSYEAARSFVLQRTDGAVVLGTVSGTRCGSGWDEASAGMTLGELAVLAADLGAVEAMGLDGGGSSSLVLGGPDGSQILNVPTGGADVPRGAERFISTALLIHRR